MKVTALHTLLLLLAIAITSSLAHPTRAAESLSHRQDTRFRLNGTPAHITKSYVLPYIDSEYTRLFKFDSADNPRLSELRSRYKLEDIIAPATNEFDQQILLMDWVHHRFQKFGQPTKDTRGALDILAGINSGETFFCTQYAQLLVSAAASLGWVDRVLALRRHQDAGHTGSTEHSTTEIWSNYYRKWIMLDPTSNMYLERHGVPLNAFEIRQEWFYNGGKDLVFVIGKDKKRYRKSDLPIYLKTFPGFGDLTIDPHELDKYGFIGYIPNTDLMDSGFNYGDMFITKDRLCDGTKWHTRKLPQRPATDPYFPIQQAALILTKTNDTIHVHLQTFTPNFKQFQIRLDHSPWQPATNTFIWRPHPGWNRLQARAVNQFHISGPASEIELQLEN